MSALCFYCGKSCRPTFVYVVGETANPPTVKVGYSGKPRRRLATLRKKCGRDLDILGGVQVACEFKAMDIETASHRLLRDHWSGHGEWFACDPATAIDAVHRAGKRLGLKGQRP